MGSGPAPSFNKVAEPDDRILYINTFSKNWAMTGWRIGWLQAPAQMGQVIENLIQYSTSGVPVFSQRAAFTALTQGAGLLCEQIERAERGRKLVLDGLLESNRVKVTAPEGAFYLFFGIDGIHDSRQAALDLVAETGVGVAPGSAFGSGGEAFFRLCYARNPGHLEEGARRIVSWIAGL